MLVVACCLCWCTTCYGSCPINMTSHIVFITKNPSSFSPCHARTSSASSSSSSLRYVPTRSKIEHRVVCVWRFVAISPGTLSPSFQYRKWPIITMVFSLLPKVIRNGSLTTVDGEECLGCCSTARLLPVSVSNLVCLVLAPRKRVVGWFLSFVSCRFF